MFKTISVTAKTLGIPCATLRRMVKQKSRSGFLRWPRLLCEC